jgi:cysteine desulfurase/selenocysteine lyase
VAPAPVRRYLDNAATSWPKPPAVWAAWEHAAREIGAAPGRGTYREALAADAIRGRCRAAAARALGGVDPLRVALPAGATLAANLALHGLLRPGDRVLATAADHNATLRPLHHLAARGVIELTVVPCDSAGLVDPAAVARGWLPGTRAVVLAHASNVTGCVQDAATIAAVARDRGAITILDSAQSLGIVPWPEGGAAPCFGADVVFAAGHKWLLGPAGTGILWVRPGLEPEPLVQGGTGTESESTSMPESFCERMEAGTPDLPALAGLLAALEWRETAAAAGVGDRCRGLAADAVAGLGSLPGVRVLAAPAAAAPIVGFTVAGYDPADVAAILEAAAGVQVRAGYHCAACIHEHLGTRAGGTVRASFGAFNGPDDVAALVAVVRGLAG